MILRNEGGDAGLAGQSYILTRVGFVGLGVVGLLVGL